MGYAALDRVDMEQLLREAECPDGLIRQFLLAVDMGKIEQQLSLLQEIRHIKLEQVHDAEKALEHLDFLRYCLTKYGGQAAMAKR